MKPRLSFVAASLTLAAPSVALADKDYDTFAHSEYSYCDAKVLSAMWGDSVSDAKVMIGRKLGSGNQATLDSALSTALSQARAAPQKGCSYQEAGFTYADAEKIAKTWGISTAEAKVAIEQKILSGGHQAEQYLHEVAAAPAAEVQSQTELNAFFSSRYTYCDAKVLAALWGEELADAKARIGRKIGWGDQDVLKQFLQQALAAAANDPAKRCSFAEAGFSYADAQKLAILWKRTPEQAKVRVERKIWASGSVAEHQIEKLLKSGGSSK